MLDVLAVSNSSMVERQWAIIGSLETPVRSGLSPLLFYFLYGGKIIMKHDFAYFNHYLTTIPGLDAKDIREIKRAIKNKTPIVLNGAQMSGRTTLAAILRDLGATVYDDHVDCIVISMKASIDRDNMRPDSYEEVTRMINKYSEKEEMTLA